MTEPTTKAGRELLAFLQADDAEDIAPRIRRIEAQAAEPYIARLEEAAETVLDLREVRDMAFARVASLEAQIAALVEALRDLVTVTEEHVIGDVDYPADSLETAVAAARRALANLPEVAKQHDAEVAQRAVETDHGVTTVLIENAIASRMAETISTGMSDTDHGYIDGLEDALALLPPVEAETGMTSRAATEKAVNELDYWGEADCPLPGGIR